MKVKTGDTRLSSSLAHFQGQTWAPHAFQVVLELPFVEADCFSLQRPAVVPTLTFLSPRV